MTPKGYEKAAPGAMPEARGRGGDDEVQRLAAEGRRAIKHDDEEHGTPIEIRQMKYVNNLVEQDDRAINRVRCPILELKSLAAAHDTLVGVELMHMLKKRQLVVERGAEGLTPTEQFYRLAA